MEKTKEENRIYRWDNIKFILILLVVIGHAAEYYTKKSLNMKRIFLIIYSFHMPLFIFISGYFSKGIVNNRKRFKIEKVVSYMILYTILKILYFLVDILILKKENASFKLLSGVGLPWFLLATSIWISVTYLLRDMNIKKVIIVQFIFGIICGYDNSIGDFLSLSRVIVFFPFFTLGYYLDEEKINSILNNKKLKLISIILAIFIILGFIILGDKAYFLRGYFTGRNSYKTLKEPLYGGIYRILAYFITTMISLAIIYIVPNRKLIFTDLGKRTLQVYFFHKIILIICKQYGINKFIMNIYPAYGEALYILFAVLLTLILGLKIFEYPFLKILNIEIIK